MVIQNGLTLLGEVYLATLLRIKIILWLIIFELDILLGSSKNLELFDDGCCCICDGLQ